jgi:hypothetical protein
LALSISISRVDCEKTTGLRIRTSLSDDENARCRDSNPEPPPQRFLTTYAAVYNNFSTERHLNSRRYMRQLREKAAVEWKIAAAQKTADDGSA